MTRGAQGPAVRTAALLAAAGILSAGWAVREVPRPPGAPAPTAPGHVLFVDTDGWYARTPNEVAVVSPYDLTLAGLPESLPYALGPWQGSDRAPEDDVERWLAHPEVAVTRTYRRPDGATVWLSAFGSRGDASFHLFEHTPLTCYPLSGWAITDLGLHSAPLGPRPLTLRTGRASGAEGELAFAFAYVWADPARDPDAGLVSLRLAAPAVPGVSLAEARAALLDDFVLRLFATTLPWSAF